MDNDQELLDDDFEIEFSQLPGSPSRPRFRLWRARRPDVASSRAERRRRYTRLATLIAIACLVLINSLSLSWIFPAGLPLVSPKFSGNKFIAQASGIGWFALRQHPLRLPTLANGAACPVTPLSQLNVGLRTVSGIGDSSIFASTPYADAHGVQRPERSNFFRGRTTWQGEIVTWYLHFPDVEPVLVRGAQLDGPNILRFDGGIEQPNFANNIMNGSLLSQLLISNTSSRGSPVASWTTITRIQQSGCYAYQVDTPTRSMVLVFKAVVEP